MGTLNRVTLCGRVGRDPESAYSATGTQVVKFSMATDDSTGKGERTTTWHNVVCFGKTAEIVHKWAHKGEQLLVEGRLSVRQYDAKDGTKKTFVEVVANNVVLLGGKRGESSSAGSPRQDAPEQDAQEKPWSPPPPDDDIPF